MKSTNNQTAPRGLMRRDFLKGSAATAAGLAVTATTNAPYIFVRNLPRAEEGPTIKVGILHSLSGTVSVIESSLANAELLAIEQINAKGGVRGKKLEPVVEDPQSVVRVFAEKAKKLILEDKVVAVLGCLTSASRQAVLPLFEEHNNVLLYPTFYEAQECSYNCFYTGAVPSQQLDDFVPWLIKNIGPRFYMIGSNYVYPKETNREVKALLDKYGGEAVGEEYTPLGHTEFSTNINKIASANPDVVFSDVVGDSLIAFYKQYRQFGLTADTLPIASPVTLEIYNKAMGPQFAMGHYTSFNYFQSVDTPENESFVEAYKAKHGRDAVTHAVMEAAYFQTYMLAQAIEKVGTDPDALIQEGLPGQTFDAPQGPVKIDEKNHHTWLWARIGRTNEEGQYDILWDSGKALEPDPWVDYLYPDKSCDFTSEKVMERIKKWPESGDKSGTISL